MYETTFEYTSYIATMPEKLWKALTSGEYTKHYFFGRHIESYWKVGSPWSLKLEDGTIDTNGVVLEAEPGKRLKLTWHVDLYEECRDQKDARVTYKIEPMGTSAVRLTMN